MYLHRLLLFCPIFGNVGQRADLADEIHKRKAAQKNRDFLNSTTQIQHSLGRAGVAYSLILLEINIHGITHIRKLHGN